MRRTRQRDWSLGSRGHLDLALALVGAGLVVLGLYMSAEDYARELDSATALRVFGETKALDTSHRLAYVPVILGAVLVTSAATTWRFVRVRQSPFLRRHARRPMNVLLGGAALLDVAYYADTTFGLATPHAVRAIFIDPMYALAGILIAGASWRIRSLIRPLPPGDPVSYTHLTLPTKA